MFAFFFIYLPFLSYPLFTGYLLEILSTVKPNKHKLFLEQPCSTSHLCTGYISLELASLCLGYNSIFVSLCGL